MYSDTYTRENRELDTYNVNDAMKADSDEEAKHGRTNRVDHTATIPGLLFVIFLPPPPHVIHLSSLEGFFSFWAGGGTLTISIPADVLSVGALDTTVG